MKFLLTLASLVAAVSASGAVKSGHAAADLITASGTYQPSKPVEIAIRLTVDPEWHTYWVNPGEGGMKMGVEWKLPEGWTAGPVGWPVPVRFMTGELPGFGYHGELVLPVTLTPPAGASGAARIGVKLDWLTCNDSACVPGDAELTVDLKAGEPAPVANATLITKAKTVVPQELPGLTLSVKEDGGNLVLTVTTPSGVDPAALAVFPATAKVVDPGAKIAFAKSGDVWSATVPKSEHLEGSAKTLELVLTGGGLAHPATVTWPAAEAKK